MNLYTVNCQLTFAAEHRQAASRFAWKLMNDIIENEGITNATVETIDEDIPDESDTDAPTPWFYNNYPGHVL